MSADRPVSLVTGGIRGIGLAVVRALRQRGDRVHVVWRSSVELAREEERLGGNEGRVHRADLIEEGAACQVMNEVRKRDGHLDHLVHCVGDYCSGSLAETDEATWRRMLESNLLSAVHAFDSARPLLREMRGTAVFLGCAGVSELRPRRESAAYAAAKTALLVYARSLALEEAPHGVRVNTVSPGLIPHPHAHPDTLDPEHLAKVPLGRPGRAEEVAEVVAWLSSARSSYVVGADLPVSGGWAL